MKDDDTNSATVLRATGRADLSDALAWICEGRRLTRAVRTDELMAALAGLVDSAEAGADSALREIARSALLSTVDPSADLLGVENIIQPSVYRAALDEISRYTSSGTLADVTAEAVAFAQDRNPFVLATLGLVAGLSWRDLRDRVASLPSSPGMPSSPDGPWSQDQVAAALQVIGRIVDGLESAQLRGATPARPIELMLDGGAGSGWKAVADLCRRGVGYETLLAQRAVGSAWLSHRQATTGLLPALIVEDICVALNVAGLAHRRGTAVGGDTSKAGLRDLLQGEPGQVGVVVVSDAGEPRLAVAVSVARDGGTARKNGGRLRVLPTQLDVPTAVVLIGPGWADRGESLELVRSFGGRVFTERSIEDLVAVAAAFVDQERE